MRPGRARLGRGRATEFKLPTLMLKRHEQDCLLRQPGRVNPTSPGADADYEESRSRARLTLVGVH